MSRPGRVALLLPVLPSRRGFPPRRFRRGRALRFFVKVDGGGTAAGSISRVMSYSEYGGKNEILEHGMMNERSVA